MVDCFEYQDWGYPEGIWSATHGPWLQMSFGMTMMMMSGSRNERRRIGVELMMKMMRMWAGMTMMAVWVGMVVGVGWMQNVGKLEAVVVVEGGLLGVMMMAYEGGSVGRVGGDWWIVGYLFGDRLWVEGVVGIEVVGVVGWLGSLPCEMIDE